MSAPADWALCLCPLGGFIFAVEARHVVAVEDAGDQGSDWDLATRLALPAPAQRRALRLRQGVVLRVGTRVRMEAVAHASFTPLPLFLAGLAPVLRGWIALPQTLGFVLDVEAWT